MATTFQPPPPPKKSNTLLWVLLGVGGFFFLIILLLGGGIAYVAHNPAMVFTKLVTASNPNLEVVNVDKDSQHITLHDKKTGKTYTITFNDAKNGKFSMREGDGQASFSFGGGGGSAKVPSWVPDYPGSEPQAAFSAQGLNGATGSYTFKTTDSADKVAKFYRDKFESSGLEITTQAAQLTGTVLVAQDKAGTHTVTVAIGSESGNTTVAVTYVTNK